MCVLCERVCCACAHVLSLRILWALPNLARLVFSSQVQKCQSIQSTCSFVCLKKMTGTVGTLHHTPYLASLPVISHLNTHSHCQFTPSSLPSPPAQCIVVKGAQTSGCHHSGEQNDNMQQQQQHATTGTCTPASCSSLTRYYPRRAGCVLLT